MMMLTACVCVCIARLAPNTQDTAADAPVIALWVASQCRATLDRGRWWWVISRVFIATSFIKTAIASG